ncbi:NAD(P)/FAD-dependent oxidoreductase [Dongia soli]|uniref:TIGR03862 family flavoprotein n=1 Tax=Dongia soli TaxID=600628 RepID=A0ABU5EB16_9PROT|nr:TIGR03862 family flavoprotein [Dongia soli]MDY0883185.1 TIGR03862 family flavoprotein [Dongia soli]
MPTEMLRPTIAVIGAGPAGLMAAECLSAAGLGVTVFDGMATPGRKFLMAGRGGLNLTHSERIEQFVERYGLQATRFRRYLSRFSPQDLRSWADGLGAETFIGSSGRVFPKAMKASGLLRAWLARLVAQGVDLRLCHHWQGWSGEHLLFRLADGDEMRVAPEAIVLALGGASWPKLGADGGWISLLEDQDITVRPMRPSNCGFETDWSAHFRDKAAGRPLKNLMLSLGHHHARGEVMITGYGIEGGPVYALSAAIRDSLADREPVAVSCDLKPDMAVGVLAQRLAARRHGQSLSQFLKKDLGLAEVTYSLLREVSAPVPSEPHEIAALLKALPIRIYRTRPIEQAISSAGGIDFASLTEDLMLRAKPGIFVCGEMLDWEAPTGGYLLQGCLSTAVIAADGVRSWLSSNPS